MSVTDALLAIARSDRMTAIDHTRRAAGAHPDALLPTALLRYLEAQSSGDVYTAPDALTRFIDGGSNRLLYDALHSALRARHDALGTGSLLDLGCGEGRVARAVAGPKVQVLDLVEPSEALLAKAAAGFEGSGKFARTHAGTAAAFLAGVDAAARWDAVQSTFAMHTMEARARASVLAELTNHTGRLFLAEFDVPDFADHSREHALYVVTRYERGLREYLGDDVVAQGFLMPVLVGQFDPTTVRHTFEQSTSAWTRQLVEAGWRNVTATPLHDYWWAPGVLLEASC